MTKWDFVILFWICDFSQCSLECSSEVSVDLIWSFLSFVLFYEISIYVLFLVRDISRWYLSANCQSQGFHECWRMDIRDEPWSRSHPFESICRIHPLHFLNRLALRNRNSSHLLWLQADEKLLYRIPTMLTIWIIWPRLTDPYLLAVAISNSVCQ